MAADQIKDMQRSDPVAKEQWYAYCEAYGDNIRDPKKHDTSYITNFIDQYNSGARLEYKEGATLVTMIKMGQKKSQCWKAVWEQYCQTKLIDGKPKFDPNQHDAQFLEGFFDHIGKMALGMGMMTGSHPMTGGEPPNKRMRGNDGKGQGMSLNLGGELDQLVQRIKSYQRQGQMQKDNWHSYCDANLGSMYDPSRHDVQTLQSFIDSNDFRDVPTHTGGAYSGGGGSWGSDQNYSGSMGGGDSERTELVAKIKGYQRMGQTQKDEWHSFCDQNLEGKYDPSRTEISALQHFIATYGL